MIRPRRHSPLQIWATGHDTIQITWGYLPPGEVTFWAGDAHWRVHHDDGGPGGVELDGLDSDHAYRIDVRWHGGRTQLEAHTLARPPGELVARVATVSDLHLGATRWGLTHTMRDRSDHEVPFPMRCARAAVSDARAWGADLLLVKGDAAHHQTPDDFRQVGELLDGVPDLPVMLVPGNHDVDAPGALPMPARVGSRGVRYIRDADHTDLDGVRVIAADTSLPGRGSGSLVRVGPAVLDLAADAPGPCLIGLHHHLEPYRVPLNYPLGVGAPGSTRFVAALAAANPASVVTSGHTHRNRCRRYGPVLTTEVASTRDWPGVWAAYSVFEGGVTQVVRRALRADAVTWHEYSRRALAGIWEWWSSGPISQRCIAQHWPSR
ncbi:MAG: metallophosphoesterase [Actinomycetota bacterium]